MIMDCISTVSYSVQVNGEATGLSALLTNGLRLKRIKGVSVAQGAPILSHLFFADDSILFCNAHLSDVSNLLQILRVYEQASGQIINFDKSAACFNPETDPITKQLISDMHGVRIVASHERYLGLPTLTQQNKNKMFNHVRDMLWQKLSTWNSKLLSAVGKEVLIKAVGQALPTYTMGVFRLPQNLCHEPYAMLARYWWGRAGGRGIHWTGWQKLCKPKCLGGIGFENFEAFNKAMVAHSGTPYLSSGENAKGSLFSEWRFYASNCRVFTLYDLEGYYVG
ncbi:hypothetical protein L3X38_032987 [Prunus dulcis]|uniref:Uncharacterized protein n=1 Tax=Prunus dulcis TaxID=3755 RepID=A0AAD4VGI1_PRUDU|nr:hypothetical protein L3X38_032987 [Prunus dulcis]